MTFFSRILCFIGWHGKLRWTTEDVDWYHNRFRAYCTLCSRKVHDYTQRGDWG
jgi:hypothetical protein